VKLWSRLANIKRDDFSTAGVTVTIWNSQAHRSFSALASVVASYLYQCRIEGFLYRNSIRFDFAAQATEAWEPRATPKNEFR
jgi:hypothetical protein